MELKPQHRIPKSTIQSVLIVPFMELKLYKDTSVIEA